MAVKPGYKTTEFWVNLLIIVGSVVFSIADKLPARYAAIAVAVSGGAYALARGLAKTPALPPVVAPQAAQPTTVAPPSGPQA